MFRNRLGAVVALVFAIVATVGAQDPKVDPKAQPPKVDPKAQPPKTDPKAQPPKEDPKTQPPKTDPKTQPPKTEPPKTDPNARRFDLKLEKDKRFYQELNTSVTQVIKVQGQDLTQKQDSTFFFMWTPTKQEGDKWFVEQQVEGVKMTIDISGNVISYDSSKADGGVTAGNPTLTQFFKELVGSTFVAVLDKNQRVERVEGKDAFIKKLGTNAQMESLLKNIMTDDALKQMCDPTFGLTPDSPKKVGETWKRDSTLNLGPIGTYTITYTFKYVGPEKDMDKIEVESTLVYAAPKANPEGLLFRIKEGKLVSSNPTKGVILYNPRAQRIESAEIGVKLTGDLVVTIGGADTKVELNQEQKTTIKTSDTSLLKK